MTVHGAGELVDTFEPVDPATVIAVVEQRAEIERLWPEGRSMAQREPAATQVQKMSDAELRLVAYDAFAVHG